mgnify:CR=1 FL=1
MIKSNVPLSDVSIDGMGDLTDSELDTVAGGEYSTLLRVGALGMIAGAQTAAGVKWAYVNTNCLLCGY